MTCDTSRLPFRTAVLRERARGAAATRDRARYRADRRLGRLGRPLEVLRWSFGSRRDRRSRAKVRFTTRRRAGQQPGAAGFLPEAVPPRPAVRVAGRQIHAPSAFVACPPPEPLRADRVPKNGTPPGAQRGTPPVYRDSSRKPRRDPAIPPAGAPLRERSKDGGGRARRRVERKVSLTFPRIAPRPGTVGDRRPRRGLTPMAPTRYGISVVHCATLTSQAGSGRRRPRLARRRESGIGSLVGIDRKAGRVAPSVRERGRVSTALAPAAGRPSGTENRSGFRGE